MCLYLLDEDQSLSYLCGTPWDRDAVEEYVVQDLALREVHEPVAVLLSDQSATAFYVDTRGSIL